MAYFRYSTNALTRRGLCWLGSVRAWIALASIAHSVRSKEHQGVARHDIASGKPRQDGFVESLNARRRHRSRRRRIGCGCSNDGTKSSDRTYRRRPECSANGPLEARHQLVRMGAVLVTLDHRSGTYLGGGALRRTDGKPVVALTLRHDRVDNFWFTLLHQCAHVSLHLDRDRAIIVDDLDVRVGMPQRQKRTSSHPTPSFRMSYGRWRIEMTSHRAECWRSQSVPTFTRRSSLAAGSVNEATTDASRACSVAAKFAGSSRCRRGSPPTRPDAAAAYRCFRRMCAEPGGGTATAFDTAQIGPPQRYPSNKPISALGFVVCGSSRG